MTTRHRYAECKINGHRDLTMLAVTGFVCAELGIEIPTLTYMRECDPGSNPCHEYEWSCRGAADVKQRQVFVHADLCASAMIETLAHELRHLWQFEKGHVSAARDRVDLQAYRASPAERDAVAYGGWWAERIPVPVGAELASGMGQPDEGYGKRLKYSLPSLRTELWYLDIAEQDLWFLSDNIGYRGGWRRQGMQVTLRGERTPAFNSLAN